MELIDKQRKLEADLVKFEKQRSAATVKIRATRKVIDEFKEEHGNVIHMVARDAEWAIKQTEATERRKDPKWQKWHKEWLAEREKERLKNSVSVVAASNPNAFSFIHESVPEEDKELFFGPLDGIEEFVVFDDKWIMAHVLVHVGLFPSLSQARKNGGEGPIKEGFSDFTRGKGQRRKEITILNKF